MQTIEEIIVQLESRGYKAMSVNVRSLSLYYLIKEKDAYVTVLFDYEAKIPFTKEQYHNVIKQIRENLYARTYKNIHLISLVFTKKIDDVKELFEEDLWQWIVDTEYNRLIIYENQPSTFLDLKKDIEEILKRKQVSNAKSSSTYQKQEDNRYTQSNSTHNNKKNQYNTNSMDDRYNYNNESYNQYSYNNEEQYSHNGEYNYNNQNDQFNHYSNNVKPARLYQLTLCNSLIILANIIVFLWMQFKGATGDPDQLVAFGGMFWPYVTERHEYYRIITHMFLHDGLAHIGNNMLVLFIIGDNLERAMGKVKYTVLYFGAGIVAGLVSMGYNMYIDRPVVGVGASGAIFGVVGAMLYVVIVNRGRLEDLSTRQLLILAAFGLYGGFTSQGVDNMAHVGGFIGGFIIAFLLYRRPKKVGGV